MDPNLGSTSDINLSNDCLLNIYEKIQGSRDRNSFGLTCRHWLQVQNLAVKSLIFHFSDNPKVYRLYASYLPRLLTRFPNLSSISVAGCTELPDSELIRIRDCGSKLRSLALYCCFGITDNGLSLVSAGCPNLVSVTLYRCNITDPGLESLATSCHSLENLNLSYCTLITDHGISILSRECNKLHAVMISYCRSITGTGFRGCSPTLSYLEADSCVLSPEGLSGVVRGGGLEYLNLSNLRYWNGVDGLGAIGDGFATSLRFLNLRMCRFVSDDSVVAIAKGCPLLEEWSLAVCHEVRTTGWAAIGSDCKSLKVLHVNRCRNFCDRGLQSLRDGCSQLRLLYMHGCRRVSCLGFEIFSMLRQDVEVRNDERMSVGPCIDDLFA
ncbi:uncharacterized protein A4U43_C09F5040 [Asparagus officinalis]|uniref:COI1 F-box domain-containing protein n=1 Tax=Asparagus officinalis TaxID=4686 RepID=A0A5P1E5Y0_ASPOF|nr:F-box/LRR-repeat protein 12 [Asparagus officinalis]ONK57869.1 uncharacterized protein A4U43_C09F5040 [Asparagus officinalis]